MTAQNSEATDRLLEIAGLSDLQQRLMHIHSGMPLASVSNEAVHLGVAHTNMYPILRGLSDEGDGLGLLTSAHLGATMDSQARLWMTGRGRLLSASRYPYWHEEWARCRLLERLPAMEWFYHVAGELLPIMGPLLRFRWAQGQAHCASGEYENGLVAILWSGILEGKDHLERRWRQFLDSLYSVWHDLAMDGDWSIHTPIARPAMVCVVVPDQWQREIVQQAVVANSSFPVRIWCVADGTVTGANEPGRGFGRMPQPLYRRDLGGWPWVRRVSRSPWGPGYPSPITYRLLLRLFEFSGMTATIASRMLTRSDRSQAVENGLKQLADGGFACRTKKKNFYQYWITERGADVLVKLDRTVLGSVDGRAVRSWRRKELSDHDREATSLLARFAKAGLPVANGWRSWEDWGDGALAPDGMVRLEHSPYGPGWHYLEQENSARRRFRVGNKLRNYGSGKRQDDWPVAFVLWDDEAEGIFQELGRNLGLRLLTTTKGRLEEYGPLGPCWSMYGRTVTLG